MGKFRRRRECKTDYYARKRMVTQDLNKYGTPKFRLVTRITNAKVICQVVYSMQKGDFCICQANSQELSKWGLTTGFTSYSAAYATGLLVARRLLTKYNMADMFKGVKSVDGVDYDVSADVEAVKQDRRPFKAILDIGTTKPTTGNRVFGALKGACDGGLHVPHSVTKYPGYFREEDKRRVLMTPKLIRPELWDLTLMDIWTSLEKMRTTSINNSANGINAYKLLRSKMSRLYSKRSTKVSERTQSKRRLNIKRNQLTGKMIEEPLLRPQRENI